VKLAVMCFSSRDTSPNVQHDLIWSPLDLDLM